MSSKIVRLIRHASTPATAGKRFIGSTDMGLSKKGRIEARRLSRAFAEWGSDIWSSPMKRCLETAGLANAETQRIKVHDDLKEIDFGLWEGLTFEEIQKTNSKGAKLWLCNLSGFQFPGGEAMAKFDRRTGRISGKIRAHPHERLLVLAHGGVIRGILRHLLDLPASAQFRFEIEPASVTEVRLSRWGGSLAALNDRSHLRRV